MGLSRVVSFLIFWDRPLSLTLSLQTHLRIFLHAFTDLWIGTTHTLTNQQNRKPNSKLTPCLSWKSPESTIFLAPMYSSKIKHLLRYGLWGQSSRCSLDPLSLWPDPPQNATMHAFLHSIGLKTYDLIALESKMYSENTWLWTVYTTLPNATQRDWLSCKMISSTTGFKSFPHSHSKHSFYPPSGFPRWPLILT